MGTWCSAFGLLCRNTHSRHLIRRPTAVCRWKSINLCSFSHSAQSCTSAHLSEVCACARHIYQFVLIRWHRGRVPRVWERRDHGNYLVISRGHYQLLAPIFSVIIPPKPTISSFHLPAQMLLMIDLSRCFISWKTFWIISQYSFSQILQLHPLQHLGEKPKKSWSCHWKLPHCLLITCGGRGGGASRQKARLVFPIIFS